jgi:uncharacterized protein (DUF885 family)
MRRPALAVFLTALALGAPGLLGAAGDEAFRALVDREWQWRLREDPLFATSVGVHDYDDRLPSVALDNQARRDRETRAFLAELAAIDRAGLSAGTRVDYDIFRTQLEERVESFRFSEHFMPLNADSGFHSDFAQLPDNVPLQSVADYDHYLARLAAFPRYMDEQIAAMREGLRRGLTLPRVTLQGTEDSIRALIVDDPVKSVFWAPFTSFPAFFSAADRARLEAAGRETIARKVSPAYAKFLAFMSSEYIPGCRESLAAHDLPDGAAYYRFLIRRFTTLDLAPETIHETGLREVAKLRAEMDEVIRQTGFSGDFAAFLAFLRSDPRFYAKTPEELLKEAAWIAKRMDGKLPALFGKLPRKPYTVEPVPAHIAPKYTAGRYVAPPEGGTQPGIYWVNTHALDMRPLYNLEALTFHEAVPGHHLQGALAQEQEALPNFRRYSYISAYGEGWGLYSEWLGLEAGFYTDPYSNFGRLTYAMWRACRLVVDTGIHSKGWTRQQAVDYLAGNTALPLHEVETEIDRYISWPGQALSYKLGELKIRELRQRAEQALGERFDVRAFHDRVLQDGSVPLTVLEASIDEWIAIQLSAEKPAR